MQTHQVNFKCILSRIESKLNGFLSADKKYEHLLVDVKGKNSNVALVQLNRPKALNALCDGLMKEVYFSRLIVFL